MLQDLMNDCGYRARRRAGRGKGRIGTARPARTVLAALLVALASAAAVTAPPARAAFTLGLDDPGLIGTGTAAQARTARRAAAVVHPGVIRISVHWAAIAPGGHAPPAGFAGADPASPGYSWSGLDAEVRAAAQHHARILLAVLDAPSWAEGPGRPAPDVTPGSWNPNPTRYTQFVTALGRRYDGHFPDPAHAGTELPRVSAWSPWNEPNIPGYFAAPDRITAYRTLLADAYTTLKRINRTNTIVLGGLAPVSSAPGATPPLRFAAALLCLRPVGASFRAARPCPAPARFDVLGIHPYNLAASPTLPAGKPGDVLVADLPKLGRLLSAAARLHTTAAPSRHALWVDEWAWPTDPPDSTLGDPPATAARFVAYSLYEMWRSGVSLVVWQTILDRPGNELSGGGLYTAAGAAKPSLQAFVFPLVATESGGGAYVWGRAPVRSSTRVVVQRRSAGRWRTIAALRTAGDGVFAIRSPGRRTASYRAYMPGGSRSLPYSSAPIAPRRLHLTG